MDRLGVNWYLNFKEDMSRVPEGYNKLPRITRIFPADLMSREEVASMVQSAPAGSYWYVGSEMNRRGITGNTFADVFRYYYDTIREFDPSARFTGPSILNWDFTCLGCEREDFPTWFCEGVLLEGYLCGKVWLKDFIISYESKYGEKVPVDVWAIDAYPIDWRNTPNNSTTPSLLPRYEVKNKKVRHSQIVIEQLEGMRLYLDARGYADTPIWITEVAIHLAYDGWDFVSFSPRILRPDCQDYPEADCEYHWDLMAQYLDSVLDWLEENSIAKGIGKWFFFVTWQDIANHIEEDGYMGIIFFDGPEQGAAMNCLGEIYRARSLGLPQPACDDDGRPVWNSQP